MQTWDVNLSQFLVGLGVVAIFWILVAIPFLVSSIRRFKKYNQQPKAFKVSKEVNRLLELDEFEYRIGDN